MKITAPAAKDMPGEVRTQYGPTVVVFTDGVAEVDDDQVPEGLLGYWRAAGYGIDSKPAEPQTIVPEVDARDAASPELVGTELRDAAVDPAPDDFLPPVNAGEADPHGPKVVAPGVHAEGERVVAAGPVSSDPAVQSENEQSLAKRLLIDRVKVDSSKIHGADWKEGTGPLGLSDPLSAQEGVDAAKAGAAAADAGAKGEPKGNATREAWAEWAKTQGAPEEETRPQDEGGLSRDDLRAAYGS